MQSLFEQDQLAEQSLRQGYLEWLYEVDGRHAHDHPHRGEYTGLIAQRARQLLAADREVQCGRA